MVGSESEVKALRSLVRLNLEGTAFKVEESDNIFRVESNSKGLNESDSDAISLFASIMHKRWT